MLGVAPRRWMRMDRTARSLGSTALLVGFLLLVTHGWALAIETCVGDCGEDGEVTVNELITMVNVALGAAAVESCLPGDADGDGDIAINEIIAAVNNGLNGCTAPTPTPTGGSHSYVGDYTGTAGSYGVRFHVDADGSADGFLDFLTPG